MARRTSQVRTFILVLGNIVFGVLGLAIGYFILVQIRPDMNPLDLNVPLVEEMKIPKVPEWWPTFDWNESKPYTPAPGHLGGVNPAG